MQLPLPVVTQIYYLYALKPLKLQALRVTAELISLQKVYLLTTLNLVSSLGQEGKSGNVLYAANAPVAILRTLTRLNLRFTSNIRCLEIPAQTHNYVPPSCNSGKGATAEDFSPRPSPERLCLS